MMGKRAVLVVLLGFWLLYWCFESAYGDGCEEVDGIHTTEIDASLGRWNLCSTDFFWYTEDLSSDAELTIEPCSNEFGETAYGVILAKVQEKACVSVGGCGEPIACLGKIRAIIRINGDSKAFHNFFPNGITFVSLGYTTGSCINITDPNQSPVEFPNYLTLMTHRPGQADINIFCTPENRGGLSSEYTFKILIEFFETIYNTDLKQNFQVYLGQAQGTIRILPNERTEFDPFIAPEVIESASNIASIACTQHTWDTRDPNNIWFHHTYWGEDVNNMCDYDFSEGHVYGPKCYSPAYLGEQQRFFSYTVKVPAWEKFVYGGIDDVQSLPQYMSKGGWSFHVSDPNNFADSDIDKYIKLDLGDLGTFYYECDAPAETGGIVDQGGGYTLSRFLITSAEYCESGQSRGSGTIKWTFEYEGSPAKLVCIYNANSFENCTKFLLYDWSTVSGTNHEQVDISYYNSNELIRQWHAEFDEEGNVVEYAEGVCSSGCSGGSGQFERVEYFDDPDYEGLIHKKYNADGDIILWNEYAIYDIGEYGPDKEIMIDNFSFESPNLADGAAQSGVPADWSQTDEDPNSVAVFDPNSTQWSNRYDTGQTIPTGDQIMTFANSSIQQDLNAAVFSHTLYEITVDVGAFYDNGTSEALIKLVGYDPDVPGDNGTVLITLDVDEDSAPTGQGTQLIEGQWVTQTGIWNAEDNPNMIGQQLRIVLAGDLVDMDHVQLICTTKILGQTNPLLISQRAIDPDATGDPNLLFVEWSYDTEDATAIEKRWITDGYYRVTQYTYKDNTFNTPLSKTEYALLNDNPTNPTGSAYTTSYAYKSTLGSTTYPSGKRRDYQESTDSRLMKSYTTDLDTGQMINVQEYTYSGDDVSTYTDARGGVTDYTYTDDLLTKQQDPLVNGQRQETEYIYDGYQRIIAEYRKDTDGNWVKTTYEYNSSTGQLDTIVVDDDRDSEDPKGSHTGLKETTEFKYNDFSQSICEKGSDGTVRGSMYGLGGELTSDFVFADPNDFDDSPPYTKGQTYVVSQALYFYDNDGRTEYIKKVRSSGPSIMIDPNNISGSPDLVTTKYEYDFLGRRTAVVEDLDGLALRTEYEYNRQGELFQTTLPNGKWTRTYRDGRGLAATQVIGYGIDTNETEVEVTEYQYDANGNLIRVVRDDNTYTEYEYDNFDRRIKVKRGLTSE